ncbi:MBL fold metallo-hydrolase [Caldisphaera sp.]|uniref:MBL fold metallo-hydrolase n=1 Tax=Caldisphaera sp. TaxID=2060322 RepID=UPI0025BC3C58|nr:MBL fold metallo-hydrolase [Caldisphaera sp.]
MKIKWCGNSYYIIEKDNVTIAIDPHDGYSLNLKPCYVDADYIIITHNHYDHNAVEMSYGNKTKEIIRDIVGEKRIDNIRIEFYEMAHDKNGGKIFGKVKAFSLIIDGIKIVNLSDIGEKFNEIIKEVFSPVDILMIPVGGVTTINYLEAIEYIENLKPKIVLPMHYWIKGSTLPYDSIDKFVNSINYKKIFMNSNEVNIDLNTLPNDIQVFILKYN